MATSASIQRLLWKWKSSGTALGSWIMTIIGQAVWIPTNAHTIHVASTVQRAEANTRACKYEEVYLSRD